jgi:membrane protein
MDNSENELIQQTVDELAKMKFVKSVHLYDDTGQVLFFSSSENFESDSINDLYGISPYKGNSSAKFVPFVQEIRSDNLLGYLRFTNEKGQLSEALNEASNQRQQLLRLMLVLAGLVGFLLTRGFNRFSRQGYRIPQKKS